MTCLGCNRLEEAAIEVDGQVVCDQCIPAGCERLGRKLLQCFGGRCLSPASCANGKHHRPSHDTEPA